MSKLREHGINKPREPRLNLRMGQWVEVGGTLYRLIRRALDVDGRLVFESPEGLPLAMTDAELLRMQHGKERSLRLLSDGEAEAKLTATGRPRVTAYTADSEDEEKEANRRHDYVMGWVRAGRPSRTPEKLADCARATHQRRCAENGKTGEPAAPSGRNVARWIAEWLYYGESVEGLVPQIKRCGNTTDRLHPVVREILAEVVEEKYFVDTRPTAKYVHEQVLDAIDTYNEMLPPGDRLAKPSIGAVHAEIRKTDAYTRDYCRLGKGEADDRWRPTGSSPATTRHNEVWEIDHTTVDTIALDDETELPLGRPTVTSAIDRHTRVSPGLCFISFDPPGVYATMEYLRAAILPKDEALAELGLPPTAMPFLGKPDILIPDQAREFKSRAVVLGLSDLGIDIDYTPVLRPWYKGRIERFFRTLTKAVFQQVPGTTFSSIFERNKEAVPEKVAVVTLSKLRRLTNLYLIKTYNLRRHRGLGGISPMDAYRKSVALHGMDPLPNPERILAALSPTIEYRKLHHYGVEFQGLLYNSPALAMMRVRPDAPRVVRILVDGLDLTSISVVDPATGEFLKVPIKASMLDAVRGVTLQKHKMAQALRRANPEILGGAEEGLVHAYRLIDGAVAGKGVKGGKEQRLRAAAYWDKLTKARTPEQAPMFDPAGSSRGIADDLFEEMAEDSDAPWREARQPLGAMATAPEDVPVPASAPDVADVPASAVPEPADGPAPRKRGRPKKKAPEAPAPDDVMRDDEDELERMARSLGMTSTRKEDDL
jgi:putative transposase